MKIGGSSILVLGAYGEVGAAVCRRLLAHEPARLVVSSLTESEADHAGRTLGSISQGDCEIIPVYGNLFLRGSWKDRTVAEIFHDPLLLSHYVSDTFGDLNETILNENLLFQLITRYRPHIVVDCVTTATAISYLDIYQTYGKIAGTQQKGQMEDDLCAQIFATVSLPPLIRHIQILAEAMKRSETGLYLKIGTTGTGGMGFNIPFTHGEENPSRLLMTKTAVAGAHSMLLFVLNRTPGAPVIREIKPAAMIGWKDMGKGAIARRGKKIPLYQCTMEDRHILTDGDLFDYGALEPPATPGETFLEGVYVDTGENGVFSADEFTLLTSPGMMEFVTPEEIADHVVANITGTHTSKDVVGAIDGAVMGPTYRAGFLRRQALDALSSWEPAGLSYGYLGPVASKLIFESFLLKQAFGTMDAVCAASADVISRTTEEVVRHSPSFRAECTAIGIPILLGDGQSLLFVRRSSPDKAWEQTSWTVTEETINSFTEREWIDLRPQNMARWSRYFTDILGEIRSDRSETGSRTDRGQFFWTRNNEGKVLIDGGEVSAWVLIKRLGGGRVGSSR